MRFHVHVGVSDLDASIAFYSAVFGAAPTVAKADYAKWMLDDPKVNFAISQRCGATKGVEHLGIQVEDEAGLVEVYGRLRGAAAPVLEEGATTCCYAQSQKSWIADPDGVVWEAFLTTGEATNYGTSPEIELLASDNAAEGACCVPAMAPAAVSGGGCCG